jgi:hypothetical protein
MTAIGRQLAQLPRHIIECGERAGFVPGPKRTNVVPHDALHVLHQLASIAGLAR